MHGAEKPFMTLLKRTGKYEHIKPDAKDVTRCEMLKAEPSIYITRPSNNNSAYLLSAQTK